MDGIYLMEIMNKLDKTLFDIDKIVYDTKNNWAFYYQNIKILFENLQEYYKKILNQEISSNHV